MNNLDKQFKEIANDILENGEWAENRTGIRTKQVFNRTLAHDMREGFPLLTSRRVPYKSEIVELEGFIKGITSKKWFEERGCKFWSPFARRDLIPYSNDESTKEKMLEEDDLGPLGYSHGWRNFGGDYDLYKKGVKTGVDQLQLLVEKIRKKEDDRRLILSAWDAKNNDQAALPSCHFNVTCHISACKTYLDIHVLQRSCDISLGNALPKYGMFISLLANEGGLIPRFVYMNYLNCHVYSDQVETLKKQLNRECCENLPEIKLKTYNFNSIFDWKAEDGYEINNYKHSGILNYPMMAV